MTKFTREQDFHIIAPSCCGVPFGMSEGQYARQQKLKREGSWWCPSCGSCRQFAGPTEADQLRQQLQRERLAHEATQGRAAALAEQRDSITRAHKKMRRRIANGVCPCCTRTFQNLLQHMRTQHPEFDSRQQFRAMRDAFGLTQNALAREVGVPAPYVSSYERGAKTPRHAERALDAWLAQQEASE